MPTIKIQFVLWVATETVRFLTSKLAFSLRAFCFSHLAGKVNNLTPMRSCPWGASRRPIGTFVPFFRSVNILPVSKIGGVILSGK